MSSNYFPEISAWWGLAPIILFGFFALARRIDKLEKERAPKIDLVSELTTVTARFDPEGQLPMSYLVGTAIGNNETHAIGCRARLIALEYRPSEGADFRPVESFATTLSLPWARVPGDRFGGIEIGQGERRQFNFLMLDETRQRINWYRDDGDHTNLDLSAELARVISRESPFGTYKFVVQVISENGRPRRLEIFFDWASERENVRCWGITPSGF